MLRPNPIVQSHPVAQISKRCSPAWRCASPSRRAGFSLSVIGRPSILIPFAAATADHQTANARGLVEAGGAIMVPESKATPEALTEQILSVLDNPEAAMHMARSAAKFGKPDATEAMVDLVQSLATRGQGQ